ncbi:hypothetical protein [Nocardia asteroides]
MCGDDLAPGQGLVQTRHHRPYPVLCDSCMTEVDENEKEERELMGSSD